MDKNKVIHYRLNTFLDFTLTLATSGCYTIQSKTLVTLEKLSLVEIQRFHINTDNKKIKMYRSKIKKADIAIYENKSEVILHANKY